MNRSGTWKSGFCKYDLDKYFFFISPNFVYIFDDSPVRYSKKIEGKMAKDFVPVNLSNPIFGYTRYTYHYAWCTTEQSTHTHLLAIIWCAAASCKSKGLLLFSSGLWPSDPYDQRATLLVPPIARLPSILIHDDLIPNSQFFSNMIRL